MSWRIVKLGYSAGPWRIVNDEGAQVAIESKVHDFGRGPESFSVYGYDTRQAAIDALGDYAERITEALEAAKP